jgi:threonine dehydrogenase-like Zn-dependent dehydrogenase
VVLGQGGRAGCFADRVIVPAGSLHPVPEGLSDERAIFAAPLAVAAHAAALFRAEGKPYITVLGDGLLALLCAQVMARLNARVRLLGWRPERFGLCERWGIKHRHAGEVGRRHDQDVVIDASESGAGLALALGLVRPRGKLILMGEGSRRGAGLACEGLAQVVADEIELLGCRCGSIAEALAMLARGDVQTEALVARRARLDDAAMILNAPPAQPAGVAAAAACSGDQPLRLLLAA